MMMSACIATHLFASSLLKSDVRSSSAALMHVNETMGRHSVLNMQLRAAMSLQSFQLCALKSNSLSGESAKI